ncbi:uncharacterized protein LOC118326562 isoform X2 [Morone saxatilis]|uniref:uncharacterized protein LOC118326562 isoform X2 n=1 Tax=Morone saxatilis TaxID=34816 RepID=UPI0015E1DE3A|nr:uncharacterized protein LOC118326562 isoform X2 [Morone saxatilis]
MAKGKAKKNNSAPSQPRSLRSRKRDCPSDETSETDATLHHQDTEGSNTAVDVTMLQCNQSPLQESTVISTQQHQAEEQSCITKQDPATEEKHAEATNVNLRNVVEEQEETTVTRPNNDSQLEGFRVHTDNVDDQEEITAEEGNRSPLQTCTDQLQVLLPTSEGADGSCATALEEQLGAKENSQCNLERNQETSNVYMADVKEVTKEAAVGLPAKKKRRMGMCGLTEKERSHFLQTQKRENGLNTPERVELICNNTAGLVPQEEISSPSLSSSLSIPASSVTEQEELLKLPSSHCGGNDRAETEDHMAVTTSAGTSTECDPGCSKVKSCEAEGGTVPGDTESDPPAETELLGNEEQQELQQGGAAETVAEKPQEQTKEGEYGSAVVVQSPAISLYSNPTQSEGTENQDEIEAAPLHVNNVTRTRDEKKEELADDAGDGNRAEAAASFTDTQSGLLNCGSGELCKAAVTPSGSDRKDSKWCDPDDEPGLSTLNTEHPQTMDAPDPFGSGYLDYVSDSQLNTISLAEEEVMEGEEDLGYPDCPDATDLICGLIRELSSVKRSWPLTESWRTCAAAAKVQRAPRVEDLFQVPATLILLLVCG